MNLGNLQDNEDRYTSFVSQGGRKSPAYVHVC